MTRPIATSAAWARRTWRRRTSTPSPQPARSFAAGTRTPRSAPLREQACSQAAIQGTRGSARSCAAIGPRPAFPATCRRSRRRCARPATGPRCSGSGTSDSPRGRGRKTTASKSGSDSWPAASTTTRTSSISTWRSAPIRSTISGRTAARSGRTAATSPSS